MLDPEVAGSVGADAEVAELAFTVFAVGEQRSTLESWEMSLANSTYPALKIEPVDQGEKASKVIDGRFSELKVIFELPRDRLLSSLTKDPVIHLSCADYSPSTWVFSAGGFITKLQSGYGVLIERGEPALNFYVNSRDLKFFGPYPTTNQ